MCENTKVVVHLPPPTVADYERLRKENEALARQLADAKADAEHLRVLIRSHQAVNKHPFPMAVELEMYREAAQPPAPDGKEGQTS